MIVVLASRIPAPKVDAERVVMYLIKVCFFCAEAVVMLHVPWVFCSQ